MRHEQARQAIMTAWESVRSTATPTIAAALIEIENQPFSQPSGQTWYRLTFRPGDTNRASLGGDKAMNRTVFLLILQVFIPEQGGTKEAYQAADVMSGLDGRQISQEGLTVHFQTAGLSKGAIPKTTPGSGWEAFNVTIAGHYDSTPQ